MADQDKEVQFYSSAVSAWFETRLEHDKSLLTLSAGGIGLLVTLLSAVGGHQVWVIILYVLALLSFLICLGTVLWIFKANATYLEKILNTNEKPRDDCLGMLDIVAIVSFAIGAVLSSVIGVITAVHHLN